MNWKSKLHIAGWHASRIGAFSAALTALAVVAAVLFNLLIGQLPERWTQFDLTDSGIYDITDTSRDYLAGLEEDVVVHVLADEDSLDSRIVRFLSTYEELSDRLRVEYTDPLVYPSVLTAYGVDTNTVVVTCEATGRQESFLIDDIIGYDIMAYYYYGTYNETEFDGEGLLTSAIDGVLTDTARMVYQTTGHGETALPATLEELFHKAHLSVDSVNLLTDGGVPADCDLLILNAPTRDLADDELTLLLDYLSTGGQVIYTMAGADLSLPNFEALCAVYGIRVAPGLIADTQRYYQNNPYWFFPMLDNSVDAAASTGSDATVLFCASRGFTLTEPERADVTVQSFLTTSDSGHAVVDETNQTQGTFAVAATATEAIDDGITARLTVYGADSLINADITATFTNLDNTALFVAAATVDFDDVSSLAIAPVDLQTPTNTITTSGIWAILFILVIPGALLVLGFVRWARRQKL